MTSIATAGYPRMPTAAQVFNFTGNRCTVDDGAIRDLVFHGDLQKTAGPGIPEQHGDDLVQFH